MTWQWLLFWWAAASFPTAVAAGQLLKDRQ